MKHSTRIFLLSTLLIGGTLGFAFWAHFGFEEALTSIDTTRVLTQKVSNEAASVIAVSIPTTDATASTEPAKESALPSATQTPLPFAFTSPKSGAILYGECAYDVTWSGPTPSHIEMQLVDAGARKAQTPGAAGIPKDIIGTNLATFAWKVGTVWPGKYYLQVTAVDGAPVKVKSGAFTIEQAPDDMTAAQAKALCVQ